MKSKSTVVVVVLVLTMISIITALSGCVTDSNTDTSYEQSNSDQSQVKELKGTIRVSGAYALYPMVIKWGEEYKKLHPKVNFDISAGGAGKGMADTVGGLVDIGMVSRPIAPAEEEKGAYWVTVTKDAVVPTVNKDNPVLDELKANGLKREVFEKIYINETTKTWGQATETGATDKINVYTRSDASGAAATWAQYLGNNHQEALNGVGVNGDPGLAEAIRQDRLGIGFNNIVFAYDLNTRRPVDGIEIIPLDLNGNGIIDDDENFYATLDEMIEAVAAGKYPAPPARDQYLVTKGKPEGVTQDFIKWVLTDGQQYIQEVGYIVLSQDEISEGLEKIK
ncbi:MAG: substrate-binding domain-containing protein [ANME-2 cluster archaeon]|nr:substrate-binding domain-containing protein [ANME-2 cluster archaeon]